MTSALLVVVALVALWLAPTYPTGYGWSWLTAFVLTQLIEAPIYRHFCLPPASDSPTRGWWPALLPSAVTHPLLWFAVPALWRTMGAAVMADAPQWLQTPGMEDALVIHTAEVLIWLVEAGVLHLRGGQQAVRWALAGNAASYGFGLLLSATIGWP